MEPMSLIILGVAFALLLSVFLVRKNKATKKQNLQASSQATAVSASVAVTEASPVDVSKNPPAKEVSQELAVVEKPERQKSVKEALANTEKNFFGRIRQAFMGQDVQANLEQLEEILYTSDLGPATVTKLMSAVESKLSNSELKNIDTIKAALKEELSAIFSGNKQAAAEIAVDRIHFQDVGPTVLMVVGVNGAGKTTSIGKISAQLAKQGKKVLVAAGDTFRAAAGGQLKVWTDRAQVEIFSPEGVTDPSAVAFDAVSKAVAQNYDVVIIDTAGRLHTQSNLMEELKKMKRVMTKVIASAPHEVFIVLDANSGQNALMQAKEFHQALTLTGVVLTKMDGTAKGGVAVGLANEVKVPIKMIGIGEKIEDLRPFSDSEFVDSILG